jgi:hypothetical protein
MLTFGKIGYSRKPGLKTRANVHKKLIAKTVSTYFSKIIQIGYK